MAFTDQERTSVPPDAGHFVTTHWSVVLAARQTDSPSARAALEKLCQTYWYPLYAFVRRQGYSPADAEDLTQAFFERVLEKDYFAGVDRTKGRFRAFLIAALKHFLSDCRDHARAVKRGGRVTIIHLDALTAEVRYKLEPAESGAPESSYDRDWAITVVDNAVTRVRDEWSKNGKADLFECLKFELKGVAERESHAAIAGRLNKTESAIKSEAFRLRKQFRAMLREEVQNTVAGLCDIDDEIRFLARVWATSECV